MYPAYNSTTGTQILVDYLQCFFETLCTVKTKNNNFNFNCDNDPLTI